jgi:protein involved in polysaccharide export with SLBB domain
MVPVRRPSREIARCYGKLWQAVVCVAVMLPSAMAQESPSNGTARTHQASRAELEALAIAAEQLASSSQGNAQVKKQKRIEADALRARLRDGDFRGGDRIVLSVRGDSALTDTFTVHPGRTLRLPNLPELPLQGVLRAELRDHLTRHIARFLRDPVVEAHPLIRLGLLGEVDRPGYYFATTDGMVTDAIMLAGGPTREADLTKTTVRRGTIVLWERAAFRDALTEGTTLDQLDLRSGDEIIVGVRSRGRWETVLRTAGFVSGIAVGIYGATRIGR